LGDFEIEPVAAGTTYVPAPPVRDLGGQPGGDIRDSEPVPDAEALFAAGQELVSAPVVDELVIGETIPGGTTTALGVLTALGERASVSSSLPENPVGLKREIVEKALLGANLQPGELAGQPHEAIRRLGDPMLATVAGCIVGAAATGSTVMLGGGTQMAAAAAVARHAGVEQELQLATTPYIMADDSAEIGLLADDLEVDITVTDPGFGESTHSSMTGYTGGEVKEGAGMGGALALLDRTDVSMSELRDRVGALSERLLAVAE
jgi:NaMN:DMB phosphoribosyltransferase